jgi:hypothetical protein
MQSIDFNILAGLFPEVGGGIKRGISFLHQARVARANLRHNLSGNIAGVEWHAHYFQLRFWCCWRA